MRTEHLPRSHSEPQESDADASPSVVDGTVHRLLKQPLRSIEAEPVGSLHGVALAQVLSVFASGRVQVLVPALKDAVIEVNAVLGSAPLGVGSTVALMFQGGRFDLPIILGPLMGGQHIAAQAPESDQSTPVAERLSLHAEQEIELRCGDAAIVLTQDGRILLRGEYISSQATGTQRIRGASVQVN
jgi:hypothetical protein